MLRIMRRARLFIAVLALFTVWTSVSPSQAAACTRPDWYGNTIEAAAAEKGDAVPDRWGTADEPKSDFAFIFCHESGFSPGALNTSGPYYGLGQMSRSAINGASVRFECYWEPDACNKNRVYYQVLAALRYCNQRYGGPNRCRAAWERQGWW